MTFTEPGSLGMKLAPNAAGQVSVLGINPGTQGQRHAQLRPGLVIVAVAGASTRGKGYKEVLGMIKAGGRPVKISFESGAGSPAKPAVVQQPTATPDYSNMTPAEAKKARR